MNVVCGILCVAWCKRYGVCCTTCVACCMLHVACCAAEGGESNLIGIGRLLDGRSGCRPSPSPSLPQPLWRASAPSPWPPPARPPARPPLPLAPSPSAAPLRSSPTACASPTDSRTGLSANTPVTTGPPTVLRPKLTGSALAGLVWRPHAAIKAAEQPSSATASGISKRAKLESDEPKVASSGNAFQDLQ
jgi:hypothetical protein